jgi:hypothetical protein
MIANAGWKINGKSGPCEALLPRGPQGPSFLYSFFVAFKTMQDAINIIAISDKGKSRIGKKLTMAIVEQNHHDKMFIVIPGTNQCRWIKKDNDPDFRIIGDD